MTRQKPLVPSLDVTRSLLARDWRGPRGAGHRAAGDAEACQANTTHARGHELGSQLHARQVCPPRSPMCHGRLLRTHNTGVRLTCCRARAGASVPCSTPRWATQRSAPQVYRKALTRAGRVADTAGGIAVGAGPAGGGQCSPPPVALPRPALRRHHGQATHTSWPSPSRTGR